MLRSIERFPKVFKPITGDSGNMPKIESLTRDDAQRIVAYIRAVQKYNDVH